MSLRPSSAALWLVALLVASAAGVGAGAVAIRAVRPVRPPAIEQSSPLLQAVSLTPADVTPARCDRTPRGRGLLAAVSARLALPEHVRCSFLGERGQPGEPAAWLGHVVTDGGGRVVFAGIHITGLSEAGARAAVDSLLRLRLMHSVARPLTCRTRELPAPPGGAPPDTSPGRAPPVRVRFEGWYTPEYEALASVQRGIPRPTGEYVLSFQVTRAPARWSGCTRTHVARPDRPA